MTKIKNNELTHSSNTGTSNIVMASNGNVTVAGALAASGGFTGVSSTCTGNYLINGDMKVAQRGTSITGGGTAGTSKNDDDQYTLDRWNLLSDGNDIVDVTQNTEAPAPGAQFSLALDVETANKKFGILQIIETKNCHRIIGDSVSLSFKMKASAVDQWGANSVKAAVISWSSTADSVTSDVVSAWGAEGTRPTLATNWTYENANDSGTTGNFTPTTSWATYTLKNVSVDTGSTTNVAVFIWSDVTGTTAGQFLYITDVQLESGSDTTDYLRRSYGEELHECRRYYQKIGEADNQNIAPGWFKNSSTANFVLQFLNEMRVAPSISLLSASAVKILRASEGTQNCNTSPNFYPGTTSARIRMTGLSDGDDGFGCNLIISSGADEGGCLRLNAEL